MLRMDMLLHDVTTAGRSWTTRCSWATVESSYSFFSCDWNLMMRSQALEMVLILAAIAMITAPLAGCTAKSLVSREAVAADIEDFLGGQVKIAPEDLQKVDRAGIRKWKDSGVPSWREDFRGQVFDVVDPVLAESDVRALLIPGAIYRDRGSAAERLTDVFIMEVPEQLQERLGFALVAVFDNGHGAASDGGEEPDDDDDFPPPPDVCEADRCVWSDRDNREVCKPVWVSAPDCGPDCEACEEHSGGDDEDDDDDDDPTDPGSTTTSDWFEL